MFFNSKINIISGVDVQLPYLKKLIIIIRFFPQEFIIIFRFFNFHQDFFSNRTGRD